MDTNRANRSNKAIRANKANELRQRANQCESLIRHHQDVIRQIKEDIYIEYGDLISDSYVLRFQHHPQPLPYSELVQDIIMENRIVSRLRRQAALFRVRAAILDQRQ